MIESNQRTGITIYTLVSTGADADKGFFPDPQPNGSYLFLKRARLELNRLIAEEKKNLSPHYDTEDRGEDYWEMCEAGYAAARFSRIEILTTELAIAPIDSDPDSFCPKNHMDECAECYNTYGTPCCKDDESECGLLEEAKDDFEAIADEERAVIADLKSRL